MKWALGRRKAGEYATRRDAFRLEWEDVVLTRSDFACLPDTRPILFQALAGDLTSHVFLFVGYSLRDPDFTFLESLVNATSEQVPSPLSG
jgi:hypothetical protein